jgi:alpha-L-arabinofuranosidase
MIPTFYRGFMILSCCIVSFQSPGQPKCHITVDAAAVQNKIPSTLFGSCMEDVNHEIYGGLYGQMIMGESFEEPASGVNFNEWRKCGGYWSADKEYGDGGVTIVPGRHTSRMVGNTEIKVEPDESARLIYDPVGFRDGIVEADLHFLQARGAGAGLLLRTQEVGIGENALKGYEIRLNRETSKLQLIKHRGDAKILAEAPACFIADGWNHLRVVCKAGTITVYLNAGPQPVIAYTDSQAPISEGQIGLATAGSPIGFRDVHLLTADLDKMLRLVNPPHQQVSDRWDILSAGPGDARFELPQHDAYNGLAAQTIALTAKSGKAGIANRGLDRWGIAIRKGCEYKGSCFLHLDSGSLPVIVALESADGSQVYAQQTIEVKTRNWKNHPFSLTASGSDPKARFVMYIRQPGKLYVDQVSLFPTGEVLYKGLPMRADIGHAIKAEGLTFMRYAGTMVNAPGYRVKKMLGDRAKRPPYTGHWNEYSTNGFGIEEFLQFCEASSIQPAFAINIEETASDAADWVEYLDGDTSTTWGAKRAANGHPRRYGVRYIEIGNEEVMFEGDDRPATDHYIERFLSLYQAIHAKDPSIQLVCSAWWRPGSANTERIFKALDGKAAFWDFHVGGDDPASGAAVDTALTQMYTLFHQWDPATTMRCAIFEENGGLHNMQRALGHATNLNAVRRHGDFVLTACPANALQPYLQNDNDWDQCQIFFTPDTVWGMPPFYVQQMAAANALPLRVRDTVEGRLDVTATRDVDGKALVLHLVNTSAEAVGAAIHVDHFSPKNAAIRILTIAGPLSAENLPADPGAISPVEQNAAVRDNGDLDHVCPPYSYTIIRFQLH